MVSYGNVLAKTNLIIITKNLLNCCMETYGNENLLIYWLLINVFVVEIVLVAYIYDFNVKFRLTFMQLFLNFTSVPTEQSY